MDAELESFCEEIVSCIVKYGKREEDVAKQLVDKSKVCECNTELKKALLFHETPYYWAMWILYEKSNPEWHQDPNLWPPPKEYLDRWYSSKRLS